MSYCLSSVPSPRSLLIKKISQNIFCFLKMYWFIHCLSFCKVLWKYIISKWTEVDVDGPDERNGSCWASRVLICCWYYLSLHKWKFQCKIFIWQFYAKNIFPYSKRSSEPRALIMYSGYHRPIIGIAQPRLSSLLCETVCNRIFCLKDHSFLFFSVLM